MCPVLTTWRAPVPEALYMEVGQAALASVPYGAPPRPLLAAPEHELMRWQNELYGAHPVARAALTWIMTYGQLSYRFYQGGVHVWAQFSPEYKEEMLRYAAMYPAAFKTAPRWLTRQQLEALQ
jgi:hypothetical protein